MRKTTSESDSDLVSASADSPSRKRGRPVASVSDGEVGDGGDGLKTVVVEAEGDQRNIPLMSSSEEGSSSFSSAGYAVNIPLL